MTLILIIKNKNLTKNYAQKSNCFKSSSDENLSATLTPETTNSGLAENRDAAAATLSFNIVYIHDLLQIGFSIGSDNLVDGNMDKWNLNSKPWFSLGIGTNIFSKHTPSSNAGSN